MSHHTLKAATLALAGILLVAGALVYVTAPPKGLDGYRERAAATAETLGSQVETARLWAEVLEQGKATRAAALVGFEETEADANAAAAGFERYEPPAGATALRTRFVALAAEVSAALSALRIAAQRERWEEIGALSGPLPELSDELARFEERAEP